MQLEGNDREDEAAKIWQKAVKQHRGSSSVWLAAADFETRRRDFAAARDLFSKAASAKLDYPDYLLQAWIQFENHHGALADVEIASNRVRGLMRGINARRQRVRPLPLSVQVMIMLKDRLQEAAAGAVEQQVPAGSTSAAATSTTDVANETASRKRPAEEGSPAPSGAEPDAKRTKTGQWALPREQSASAERSVTDHAPPKELKR